MDIAGINLHDRIPAELKLDLSPIYQKKLMRQVILKQSLSGILGSWLPTPIAIGP